MPYLTKIAQHINDSLKQSSLKDARFATMDFLSIAQPVLRTERDGDSIVPCIVDHKGYASYVMPDDRFSGIIYHKIDSTLYSKAPGFGDENNDINSITQMTMIVWGNRNKLKLTTDEMESLIMVGLPSNFKEGRALGILSTEISPLMSNQNVFECFEHEYKGVKFFIKPEHIFFMFKYKVEMQFNKNCFNICKCEP